MYCLATQQHRQMDRDTERWQYHAYSRQYCVQYSQLKLL